MDFRIVIEESYANQGGEPLGPSAPAPMPSAYAVQQPGQPAPLTRDLYRDAFGPSTSLPGIAPDIYSISQPPPRPVMPTFGAPPPTPDLPPLPFDRPAPPPPLERDWGKPEPWSGLREPAPEPPPVERFLPQGYGMVPAVEGYGLAPTAPPPRGRPEPPEPERYPVLPENYAGVERVGRPEPLPPAERLLGEFGAPLPRRPLGGPAAAPEKDDWENFRFEPEPIPAEAYKDRQLGAPPPVGVPGGVDMDDPRAARMAEAAREMEEFQRVVSEANKILGTFNQGVEASTEAAQHQARVIEEMARDDPRAAAKMLGGQPPEVEANLDAGLAARLRLERFNADRQEQVDRQAREKDVRAEMREQDPRAAREMLGAEPVGGPAADYVAAARKAGFGGLGNTMSTVAEAAKAPEALGGALAEGAGGAEMLAAAGPVGAAVALVQKEFSDLAGDARALREGMETFGEVTQKAASNDYMGAFNATTHAAAEALGAIPIAGGLLKESVETATAPIRIFGDVVSAFVERGKQLGQYNGELAGANAMSDVRQLVRDINESNNLGPALSRLTEAQSQFSTQFQAFIEPIKKFLIETLASIMETLLNDLQNIRAIMTAVRDLISGFFESFILFAKEGPSKGLEKANATLDAVKKIWQDRHDAENKVGDLTAILNSLGDTEPASVIPAATGGGGMAPPIFGGF